MDSYQDIDLDRLRGKWADALMRRRDYLDKELRKLIEKKGEYCHFLLLLCLLMMTGGGYRQNRG